ncbi:MAG: signal peptidase II [Lentisphaeria bacterium]|nr:signal peptidase II [Lentisphaeria bacterium]
MDTAETAPRTAPESPKPPPPEHSWILLFWRLPAALAAVVFGLDQATKWLVLRAWPGESPFPQIELVPGFFSLVHYRNQGAAWGIFSDHTALLALVSLLVMAGMVAFFRHLTEDVPERAVALGVVLGGVAGNFWDRLFRREVVDFLLFYWRDWQTRSFPAFNVADTAITCGIAVFVLSSLFRREKNAGPTPVGGDV